MCHSTGGAVQLGSGWIRVYRRCSGLRVLCDRYLTVVYEGGAYSFQDPINDLKAGVMSLAVGHRHHAKTLRFGMAALQVKLLVTTGALMRAGPLVFCWFVR